MTRSRHTTELRRLLESPELRFLLGCHDALSGMIGEDAGFPGLWASGFGISATLGARDNNELSWSQVVDVAERIAEAATIPVLLDGDTGFGNFNNFRILVRELEQRGVAGVCIEDKQFPKTNSLTANGEHLLARINEFSGKIAAGCEARRDPDFCIVARTEALIAGAGLHEALTRANAYADAGADAILIHSKASKADEVLSFTTLWNDRLPIIVVPTTYVDTPTAAIRDAGVSVAIWANQLLRSSASAMMDTARTIEKESSAAGVEGRIATVEEVFAFQRMEEFRQASARFGPTISHDLSVVVFGSGDRPDRDAGLGSQERGVFRTAGALRALGIDGSCICLADWTDDELDEAGNANGQRVASCTSFDEGVELISGPCLLVDHDSDINESAVKALIETDHDICFVMDERGDLSPMQASEVGIAKFSPAGWSEMRDALSTSRLEKGSISELSDLFALIVEYDLDAVVLDPQGGGQSVLVGTTERHTSG